LSITCPARILFGRLGSPGSEGATVITSDHTIAVVMKMIVTDQRNELEHMEKRPSVTRELNKKATFIKNIKLRCLGVKEGAVEESEFIVPNPAVIFSDDYQTIPRVAGIASFEMVGGERYLSSSNLGEGSFMPLPKTDQLLLGSEAVVTFRFESTSK